MSEETPNDGATGHPRDGADTAAPGEKAVTRRAALKVLGAVPIIGVMGPAAWAQQAAPQQPASQQPRQGHDTPNQPAEAQAPASSTPKRAFFTAAEYRLATVLAEDIIPADDRSPGATQAGVAAFIDFHLSVPETSDEARVAMRGGLRWLNTECRRRFGTAYAKASVAQRHQILDDIAWPAKARPEMSHGVTFFKRFRDMAAAGFFSSATGWADLQYQGNVFNPAWQGCPEPALRKLGVTYAVMETRIVPE